MVRQIRPRSSWHSSMDTKWMASTCLLSAIAAGQYTADAFQRVCRNSVPIHTNYHLGHAHPCHTFASCPFCLRCTRQRGEVEQQDVVVHAVKQGHITRLLGLYENMGSQLVAMEEVPPGEIADRRALLATVPGRVSVPHLQQILFAWDQWVKGKPGRADLYAPSPTHLGLFLQKE